MEKWQRLSLLLCIFGVLKEFRPSEPYVTKYLNHDPMNFNLTVINQDVYPIGTYSSMVLLITIFLITDILRYKPILIINGLAGTLLYLMLIFCRQLFWIQVAEVLYGLFSACEVAYCTYIYSKVSKDHYQEVTSHTHGAYLIGRAVSGLTSQALISSHVFSYYHLNFFTVAGMVLATVWACILPPVQESVYFHRASTSIDAIVDTSDPVLSNQKKSFLSKILKGSKLILVDVKSAFKNIYILKWAIWWALATCGYYQILNYFQVLWEEIAMENLGLENNGTKTSESDWNGAVEACYTILSAIVTFGCGKVDVDWTNYGELIIGLCSAGIGVTLFAASTATYVWVAYLADIICKMIYHGIITIANSEVAKNINPDSYALIFGMTTFMGLIMQSLLTFIVNTIQALSARKQFMVYGSYFTALGAFFLLTFTVGISRKKCCH